MAQRGVDVVFQNIADPELFPKAFAALARNGRLITAGAHDGGTVPLDVKRLYLIGSVIDFNWDCLLEGVLRSHRYQFGWDCGRNRQVIEGTGAEKELTISELWRKRHSRDGPRGEEDGGYERVAKLIKPHGDRCTFLRGLSDVAYCGGRYGQTDFALFPRRPEDIGSDEESARVSIMPPAHSRLRHTKHRFFEEEVCRLKATLKQSDAAVIIGWSASGADEWYGPIFKDAARQRSKAPLVRIIDWKEDEEGKAALEARVRARWHSGPGDLVAKVCPERFPRDPSDDFADQEPLGVHVIAVTRAGLPPRRLGGERFGHDVPLQHRARWQRGPDRRQARLMRQQEAHREEP